MLTLDSRTAARGMTVTALSLTAAHAVLQFARFTAWFDIPSLRRFFDLDAEANLPTWWSSVTLAFCALLFAVLSRRERGGRWSALAGAFALLSADESAGAHEAIALEFFRHGWHDATHHYALWALPVSLLAAFAAWMAPWLRGLDPWMRGRLVLAGVIYVGGALGIEAPAQVYGSHHGKSSALYVLLVTLEESMEMAGVIVLAHALLTRLGGLRISGGAQGVGVVAGVVGTGAAGGVVAGAEGAAAGVALVAGDCAPSSGARLSTRMVTVPGNTNAAVGAGRAAARAVIARCEMRCAMNTSRTSSA
jgi:hypothetical protein